MKNFAIRTKQLGKQYQVGVRGHAYRTIREAIANLATAPFRRFRQLSGKAEENIKFWALKEVDFEVDCGEVVGIIGRNGAGKSTLLKILSRITAPTTGEVVLNGRVSSLLEVGTGFHPELTGRENIYLNGAILGMRRAEIRRNFHKIVEFAELERFIDTPVKRYSSGMYTRLAFSVAAHLESEILIVDEVLAVGDQEFQKKCIGKMDEVAKADRTVLFVSHNMLSVQQLCERAMLIDRGEIVKHGLVKEVVSHYLNDSVESTYTAEPKSKPSFVWAQLQDKNESPFLSPLTNDDLFVKFKWQIPQFSPDLRLGIAIHAADGTAIFGSCPEDSGFTSPTQPGTYNASVRIPPDLLMAGQYTVSLTLWNREGLCDDQKPAFSFSLRPGPSLAYKYDSERAGVVQVRCTWDITSDFREGVRAIA